MEEENLLEVYSWLTNEFFEKILRSEQVDSSIVVEKFVAKSASGKGENYCSKMIAVAIDYTNGSKNNRTIDLMIKAPLSAEGVDDMLEKYHLFEREYTIYSCILPEVHRMLKTIGDDTRLSAQLYLASENPKCFIFENLTKKKYRNVNWREGFNLEHLRIITRKIAKWHAATAVIGELDKSTVSKHRYPNICEDVRDFHSLFTNTLSNCTEMVANWPGYEKIFQKLTEMQSKLIKQLGDAYTTNESDFNVLTHGDLWLNNIMFKYNDLNKPTDTLFVDYAIGFWGSPAIDLGCLFFTSSNCDVQEVEWDNLLLEYHEELVKHLKMFQYPRKFPTMKDIQIAMLRKGTYGVSVCIFRTALRVLEHTELASLSILLSNTEEAHKFRKSLFSNPKYHASMKYFLDFFHRKGYLG